MKQIKIIFYQNEKCNKNRLNEINIIFKDFGYNK